MRFIGNLESFLPSCPCPFVPILAVTPQKFPNQPEWAWASMGLTPKKYYSKYHHINYYPKYFKLYYITATHTKPINNKTITV